MTSDIPMKRFRYGAEYVGWTATNERVDVLILCLDYIVFMGGEQYSLKWFSGFYVTDFIDIRVCTRVISFCQIESYERCFGALWMVLISNIIFDLWLLLRQNHHPHLAPMNNE